MFPELQGSARCSGKGISRPRMTPLITSYSLLVLKASRARREKEEDEVIRNGCNLQSSIYG